jgi:hypothetical protein
MSTAHAIPDFDELRSRVRATQHARSLPLLVIGALLVNYGVSNFSSSPMQWRYAAPLAFLLIWALGKVNEAQVGVGLGRVDYVVAAGFVFIATNLLMLFKRFVAGGTAFFFQLTGAWVAIVGVALIGIGWSLRDRVLGLAGATVVATGVAVFAVHPSNLYVPGQGFIGFQRTWQMTLVVAVGALLGLAGLLLYRRERTQE